MFSSNIQCFGFSYEEVEDIIREWNPKAEAKYVGAIVQAELGDELIYFAEILNKIRPELHISPNAVSIYCEIGYVYTRRGIDVIVIDGIQEGADNE